ncbi:putative ABC transport system ATP-binding protein [Thermosyntropha lipolytica DSM 11003]|uniref:Putative ABC transport system ATP-binding protein n=1 Tax=Thermosyntropha lipolytica DSM 11003 TaxID=1123382 RepID=A0A1M5JH78_9FIRM|nr:ATP-binding cassette domain-containing protein [Thermosyntropha lipolytica]SHG39907.1 putative ABC transport system ATP-binding protein [Thermosyntropha lipolytica DSM 11003]
MQDFFRFTELTYYLGSREREIRISGELKPGYVLVVKGPSGSGKSTLLKVMARLVKAQGGEIIYRDKNWYAYSPYAWRTCIQYVPQKPVMFRGNGRENLYKPFLLKGIREDRIFNEEKVREYLDIFSLPPQILEQEAITLSGGEAARLSFIRALLIEPSIILLDEPTAYLDQENRIKVLRFFSRWVKEEPGRGIVLISHQENDIEEFSDTSFISLGG